MDLKGIPYYVGLDCGTNSVGFAVTDKEYNLLKAKNKDMWGSHLFDEAQTAEQRRLQRNARKRLNRRKERIKILQSIFAEEVYKIDPEFFIRLNESSLFEEDRSVNNKQKYSLFNDKGYTDSEFLKDYPTIFHLRKALIDRTAKKDPRLVYLALHNIIKNRGHFLFPGEMMQSTQDLSPIVDSIKECYEVIFEDDDNGNTIEFPSNMEEILMTKKRSERIDQLKQTITCSNSKKAQYIIKSIVGYKVQTKDLFDNDEYKDLPAIEFQKASFEESDMPQLEGALEETEYKLIEAMKALYDWSLLAHIMAGKLYLSEAKVDQYDKNKQDLNKLKEVIKEYAPGEYESYFHSFDDGAFSSYIGSVNSKKKVYNPNTKKMENNPRVKRCSTDDFYKKTKKILDKADKSDPRVQELLEDIENDNFFILLRSFRNGVIPYQVNLQELKAILDYAKTFMPWLSKKDPDGFTAEEKIIETMKYRIPYYVGPLVSKEKNDKAWMVRKEEGKILPWNFYQKVDEDKSAEGFIQNLTNKCTYCTEEDVVPKESLLYQSFMVLNEINNLKFNEEPISITQKQEIYESLFKNGNVTQTKIKQLAIANGWIRKGDSLKISGIDEKIKSSLKSYMTFKPYIGKDKLSLNDVEKIIKYLTIFSDGGHIAERRIKEEFSDKLSSEEIKKISQMKFSGWGNLSKKFLTEIEAIDPETGEFKNIMHLLWDTNYNLMELIHNPSCEILENLSEKKEIKSLDYTIVEELNVSPKVKRQIWQSLKIVKEIEHIMGHKPEKVFIEVVREKQNTGRTKSRKEQLLEKIKNVDDKEILKTGILERLINEDENMITKRDRLYLYYTQLGKCMYSGEPIDLDDLLNSRGTYDIDHIYPYSQSGIDSLDNKVIVKSILNREKSNIYPIAFDVRNKMKGFWKMLKDKDLISSEKYNRLTRDKALSDEDTKGFINRQIVETSQNTIALAHILERYFGDETKIVYSKGARVSEFREQFELPKSRIVNDLHHAKDAYLNIVVGNVLNTRYTTNWFLKKPSFRNPYEFSTQNAWIVEDNKSIKTVKSTMAKNTVLLTRQQEMRTGQLFNLQPVSAGKENGMIPLKITAQLREKLKNADNKNEVLKEWTDKYGGYSSLSISHLALIKYMDKKKEVYSFITIPMIRAQELINNENLLKYCTDELKLKDPRIIKTKVLFNTLFVIDGYKATVSGTGTGGSQLILKSATPIFLDDKDTFYIKKLEKYSARKALDKNYVIVPEYDKITKEENITLYQTLSRKASMPSLQNRPANMKGLIKGGFETFKTLTLEEQVEVILNILNYLGPTDGTSNFVLLGESKSQGNIRISSKIDPKKKNVKLVFQSVTGIYEEVLDLK